MSRFLLALIMACCVLSATPVALTPYTTIDLSSGHGIGSGTVGTGHVIFGFDAVSGQTLDLRVNVTEILQGTPYRDDDSMLWLFDADGHLLAEDDDSGIGLQSRIEAFLVPATGQYFAGVTTYSNRPTLTGGVISGWEDDGSSAFNFDLDITASGGVPEPSSFALLGLGVVCLGLLKRCRREF